MTTLEIQSAVRGRRTFVLMAFDALALGLAYVVSVLVRYDALDQSVWRIHQKLQSVERLSPATSPGTWVPRCAASGQVVASGRDANRSSTSACREDDTKAASRCCLAVISRPGALPW